MEWIFWFAIWADFVSISVYFIHNNFYVIALHVDTKTDVESIIQKEAPPLDKRALNNNQKNLKYFVCDILLNYFFVKDKYHILVKWKYFIKYIYLICFYYLILNNITYIDIRYVCSIQVATHIWYFFLKQHKCCTALNIEIILSISESHDPT